MNKLRSILNLVFFLGVLLFGTDQIFAQDSNSKSPNTIQPYHENPWYWQYKGDPILLIGGSADDNPWQWTGEELTDHLDLIQSVGGNYIRNTMSDRDEGNVYAVQEVEDGMYDLDQWNDEYWNKLKFFLDETAKRDIIVQLTLWDWFDLYGGITEHPYHPNNNVNWPDGTIEEVTDFYGGSLYDSNEPVLDFQHRYIDKLLSITLTYDHIIYNVNNESSIGAEWENYWAKYIKEAADSENKDMYVTSMQLIPGNSVRHVMTNRDLYAYVDVSQNNQDSAGAVGRKHYENLIYWRSMIRAQQEGPMPINNVKVYGSGAGENQGAGTGREAVERFWRNIFAGSASTRFHRNEGGWGIGITDDAQQALKSASMFLEEFDVFTAEPFEGCESLGNNIRADYCLADVGNAYAVYFPFGRTTVAIDPWTYMDEVTIKWLNVSTGEWAEEETVEVDWTEVPWWGPERPLVISPGSTGGPGGYGSGDSFIGIIKPK